MDYLDEYIYKALKKRMKVELFLCTNEQGGFGIKINGRIVSRHHAWESFEYEVTKEEEKKMKELFAKNREKVK